MPAAVVAIAVAAINADAGTRADASHMRAGTNAVGPHPGSHADRPYLHAGGNALRRRCARGDEARG
jgi:hypothetical protein